MQKLVKFSRVVSEIYMYEQTNRQIDRQIDIQIDILITILPNHLSLIGLNCAIVLTSVDNIAVTVGLPEIRKKAGAAAVSVLTIRKNCRIKNLLTYFTASIERRTWRPQLTSISHTVQHIRQTGAAAEM